MDTEMELSRVIIRETAEEQIIILKEKAGERVFPIVIGIMEAVAIDRRLKGHLPHRPLTHDLVYNIIKGMGASLERIVISDLREHTFYAKLIISRNGEVVEVDSRPSDAIALGVANDTSIFVADHVLDEVCE